MSRTTSKGMIFTGAGLFLVVLAIGFIRVDETTWREWHTVWLVGAGYAMGSGLGLSLIGLCELTGCW
jgi:hypothetical protein